MMETFLKKYIFNPLGLRTPATHKIILWFCWYVFSFVFYEVVLVKTPFAIGNSLAVNYFLGMIPLSLFLQDKNYLVDLKEHRAKIWIYVYCYNFVFMFLGIVLPGILYDSFGFIFISRECVAFVYWILSITLTVIYDVKKWLIGALFIIVNCNLYLAFLNKFSNLDEALSPGYFMCTIGISLIVFLINMYIFKCRIKNIFEEFDFKG